MKILFIGDIMGSPGRRAIVECLPRLMGEHTPDLVIANAENAAGGVGLTHETAKELLRTGVGVLTGGNHTWRHKEIVGVLDKYPQQVLRPLNFPSNAPGKGHTVCETPIGVKVGVLNLQGCVFMNPLPSPFEAADSAVEELRAQTPVIVVDIHAEATSEKRALGWYLDGRVSAVLGTHTHVPTADEEVLPRGTAYITDVGMTGPHDSVIGMKKELVLERFLTMRPTGFAVAKGDVRLHAVLVEVDPQTGRAGRIQRVLDRIS